MAITTAILQQTSSFLVKLPAEIRVKIYREVFYGQRLIWGDQGAYQSISETTFDGRDWYNSKELWNDYMNDGNHAAPIWVSQQVRSEALPILHEMIRHDVFCCDAILFPTTHVLFNGERVYCLGIVLDEHQSDFRPHNIRRIFPNVRSVELLMAVPDSIKTLTAAQDPHGIGVTTRDLENNAEVRKQLFSEIALIFRTKIFPREVITNMSITLEWELPVHCKSNNDDAILKIDFNKRETVICLQGLGKNHNRCARHIAKMEYSGTSGQLAIRESRRTDSGD